MTTRQKYDVVPMREDGLTMALRWPRCTRELNTKLNHRVSFLYFLACQRFWCRSRWYCRRLKKSPDGRVLTSARYDAYIKGSEHINEKGMVHTYGPGKHLYAKKCMCLWCILMQLPKQFCKGIWLVFCKGGVIPSRFWHTMATRIWNFQFRAIFVTNLVKSQYWADAYTKPTDGHTMDTRWTHE